MNAILGDPDVMQFSDRGVLGEKDQAAWLQNAIASNDQYSLPGFFAIERRQDRRIIGYISLSRDLTRVERGEAEIGFRLAKQAWGQGYASEAVAAMIETFAHLPATAKIVAIVDPHNLKSVKVLEKAGMAYCRDIMFPGYDYPDHLYVRDLKT
ncbi:GNAT family N-acetyltransferase [Roseibium sp.]|uniref:GNAT family N-acetyltransferase n=1 Tax=Roseibium sp. TaxID=1936156 RepID=UPI003BAD6C2C